MEEISLNATSARNDKKRAASRNSEDELVKEIQGSKGTKEDCTKDGVSDILNDSEILESFEIGAAPMITKKEAMSIYCLPEGILAVCQCVENENPQRKGWSNLKVAAYKWMFYMARRMCNPYEHIDHLSPERVSFMNRSALKLANINALFDFTLIPQTSNNTFTSFADLCGAPGGFSEYLLYFCNHVRNMRSSKGFGMSLLGTNQHGTGFQWNLPRPVADGIFQIIQGSDGSGDIYNWENIQFLKEFIENDTKDQQQMLTNKESISSLCDLVVADGGLDAQRESEIQEYLTFELVVNQVAAALLLLNHGGNFVMKFFGSENYS